MFPWGYGAMVRVGAVYLKDGEVICRRDPPGWYIISRYPTGIDVLAEEVAKNLREAGFFIKVTEDAMPYKWGKLMANLSNAVGAITNAREKETGFIGRAAMRELEELLDEAKIKWVSQAQTAKDWPDITAPLRGSMETEAQSSTWQSLAREQGTVEAEFLNGEVVRLAARLGRQAPVNEKIMKIVLEMAENREHPGKYTPEQLGKMLGLVQ
jgi:2-dehydropantoate 2-reductase